MAGRKWDREARRVLLGWTCFLTCWCVWDVLSDLVVDGPQKITSVHVVARVVVAAVFWLVGALLLRWLVRTVNGKSESEEDADG